jgi:hypothetical protein
LLIFGKAASIKPSGGFPCDMPFGVVSSWFRTSGPWTSFQLPHFWQ